jgi:hypothetical protein
MFDKPCQFKQVRQSERRSAGAERDDRILRKQACPRHGHASEAAILVVVVHLARHTPVATDCDHAQRLAAQGVEGMSDAKGFSVIET